MVRPASHRARCHARTTSGYSASREGRPSCRVPHQACQSCSTATSAATRVPATSGPSAASSAPIRFTSRKARPCSPACGTIAEWNFSAPCRDWRHWK
ncbi:hypothetical protein BG846_00822 [Streptomyces fradiae ATCC 10745 = DSM 40063]|uniref:Uncharacterized protein n=1 Tax=Streptomyces fradiae ATCC 10745 = DSM 40063 TaxID=1319510 RepID=A0A1Y2P2Q3_STRFR|nr:hypothetical protein BG846_00822 [Streptomyces fradiae ATCC 10745 = DSM 40063]